MTYKLSEQEQKTINGLQAEFKTSQDNLLRIQGAFNGCAQMLASQQNLIVTGREQLQFSSDFSELTVTSPDTSEQRKEIPQEQT
jgi:predicted transcriptional regulator YdeE